MTFQADLIGFNAGWKGFVFLIFFLTYRYREGKKQDRSGGFLKETVFNLVPKTDVQLPGK